MSGEDIKHDALEVLASNTPPDIQSYIEAYVEQLKYARVIRSAAVEQAFRRVPRHRLVQSFYTANGSDYTQIEHDPANPDPQHLAIIYSHNALVTRLQDGVPSSSSSQPGLVAEMLKLLELDEGMNVLEIGAGTGYNAALLAEIVGKQTLVTTVDVQPDVVAQTAELLAQAGYGGIRIRCADGFFGSPEAAPFDRVIVTVGSPDVSPYWVAQLTPTGRILLPLRHVGANPLVVVARRDGAIEGKVVGWSGFMAIQGKLQDDTYWGRSVPENDLSPTQMSGWSDLYNSGDADDAGWRSQAWASGSTSASGIGARGSRTGCPASAWPTTHRVIG